MQSAYTYMLERVGYEHFFNANQWQSMSCDHFCVIIDWPMPIDAN